MNTIAGAAKDSNADLMSDARRVNPKRRLHVLDGMEGTSPGQASPSLGEPS